MRSCLFACARRLSLAVQGQNLRTLAVLCLLIGAFTCLGFGQEATIVGTITDPSGAAVPNVAITITNTDTGQAYKFASNDVGQYVAPGLRIGHYKVRAEAAGFKVIEQQNLVLAVGDRSRVDFKLELGSAEQQVTVEANAIAVQSDSSEISDVITGKQVTQLATNGRSIYTLVNLTPGASSLQSDFQVPTPVGGDANVSFNGNRPGHNIYLLDGGENLDRGGSGTFSVMPSLDAIAEFRTLTSNYSAEYGLSSAATMTTVLKSGTNKYHASAWEFVRNDALDANDYFRNRAGKDKAKLRYNTYGFNVGGPVDGWNKGPHKTFFFYNMEWRKLIQGGNTNQKVPPTSAYGGNFTGVVPADVKLNDNTTVVPNSGLHVPCQYQLSAAQQAAFTAAGITTYSTPGTDGTCGVRADHPLTDQPHFVQFPAIGTNPLNVIPTGLLNGNAQALLGAGIFPGQTSGSNFVGGNDSPTFVREEIVRVDHQFNDKFTVFGHWISEQISQTFGTTMWSGDNVPTIGNTFGNPSYSAVIHSINTISPTLINEAAFNYNGNRIHIIPKGLVAAPSGFTFNRVFGGPNDLNRIPIINLSQFTGTQYSANWTPWNNKADSYQLRDDISWTKGAHQLKFGGSWLLYKKIQDLFASTQGNFQFNGAFTGNDFADFLLGYSNQYQEAAVKDNGKWNAVSWAAYVQDNWRVNNRLTLNLGLRWDGVPHTYEANGRTSNFYPNLYDPNAAAVFNTDGSISSTSPGLGPSPNPILAGYQFYINGIGSDGKNGIPKGLVKNHWAAFGPRIGFAYDVTGRGKTVVRGGFGIMYERVQGNDMYNAGTNVPYSAQVTFNNVSLSDPQTSVTSGNTLSVPIVASDITGINSNNYKLPVSYQYSFSVQQSLTARTVFSASYVGNQNRHQNYWREINLPAASTLGTTLTGGNFNQNVPYLGFHGIRLAENGANAHYNSLQLELRGNVTNDLSLQVGYTLSKAEDPAAGNGNGYDLNNVSNPYVGWKYDLGPSFFDRTHVAFVNYIYDLPIFRHTDNRLLKSTLGGWQLSGIVSVMTGAPLNITYNGDSITSIIPNSTNRPDITGPITYPKTVDHWFSGNFSAPGAGQWGNLKHGAVRGPGRQNWNMSLFKSFGFSADNSRRLEFRAEAFNIWNHTQFRGDAQGGGIVVNAAADNFGEITSAYLPRTLQLGLKLIF